MITEDYNDKIIAWGTGNLQAVKSTISALGIKHRKYSPNSSALQNNITVKYKKDRDGMINRIAYGMPRSGVFVHKGVGRGHKKDNPREAKRWFDIPTEINLPELQQIVAEQDVTYVINNLNIK